MTNDDKKVAKSSPNYYCKKCHYKCCRKNDFEKHCETKKHKSLQNDIFLSQKVAEEPPQHFSCICGKFYSQKPNLYRHRKTCGMINKTPNVNDLESVKLLITTVKDIIIEKNNKILELTSIINTNNNNNLLNF